RERGSALPGPRTWGSGPPATIATYSLNLEVLEEQLHREPHSFGRRPGVELADEVVVTHDVPDERLHPVDQGIERTRVNRRPKARSIRVLRENELSQPVGAVAAAKEPCGSTVGVYLHRDRVVRLGAGASLG